MEEEVGVQLENEVVDNTPLEEVETQEVDSAQDDEQQENPENKADDKPKDEYSKKARKAIKWREKMLSREREEKAQLAKQLDEMRAEIEAIKSGKQAVDNKPKQEDFNTWEEYNEALADYKVDLKLKAFQAEQAKSAAAPQVEPKEQYNQERLQHHEQRSVELSKLIPDYVQVVSEVSDEIDDLPTEHQALLLELDDAPAAVYVLALEDKLERLGSMSLNLAAAELIRAFYFPI